MNKKHILLPVAGLIILSIGYYFFSLYRNSDNSPNESETIYPANEIIKLNTDIYSPNEGDQEQTADTSTPTDEEDNLPNEGDQEQTADTSAPADEDDEEQPAKVAIIKTNKNNNAISATDKKHIEEWIKNNLADYSLADVESITGVGLADYEFILKNVFYSKPYYFIVKADLNRNNIDEFYISLVNIKNREQSAILILEPVESQEGRFNKLLLERIGTSFLDTPYFFLYNEKRGRKERVGIFHPDPDTWEGFLFVFFDNEEKVFKYTSNHGTEETLCDFVLNLTISVGRAMDKNNQNIPADTPMDKDYNAISATDKKHIEEWIKNNLAGYSLAKIEHISDEVDVKMFQEESYYFIVKADLNRNNIDEFYISLVNIKNREQSAILILEPVESQEGNFNRLLMADIKTPYFFLDYGKGGFILYKEIKLVSITFEYDTDYYELYITFELDRNWGNFKIMFTAWDGIMFCRS